MSDFTKAQRRYDDMLPEDFEHDEMQRMHALKGWRLIKEKLVKARIEHQCFICGQPIQRGETYTRIFGVYEGLKRDECECNVCASPPEIDYETEDE